MNSASACNWLPSNAEPAPLSGCSAASAGNRLTPWMTAIANLASVAVNASVLPDGLSNT